MSQISIVIPVFNVEKYLTECLGSIVQQSFNDFECILIDDGSTDSSGAICDEFAFTDKRFVVHHQKNMGVCEARNVGINIAKGPIITFVDADDWIEREYCQTIVSYMYDKDLCFFQANHHWGDSSQQISFPPVYGNFMREKFSVVCRALTKNNVNYDFFGYTWNKAFNLDIIKKHKLFFADHISVREDELFTLQYISFAKNIFICPKVIYNYRVLDTGLTSKKNSAKELLLLAQYEKNVLLNHTNQGIELIFQEKILGYLTDAAIVEKNFFISVKYFFQAYKYSISMKFDRYFRKRENFLYKRSFFIAILFFVCLRIKEKV